MSRYLVTIFHSPGFDPTEAERQAMSRAIDALNEEMETAGVRAFAGRLHAPSSATWLRAEATGAVVITDGPYLETREYISGFWVLDAPDLDKALVWARKAARACRVPVEVRPFQQERTPGTLQG